MKFLLLVVMFIAQTPNPAQIQTGTITGRLLALNGTPAAGVRVSATPSADPAKPSGTSNGDGSVLTALTQTDAAGRYRLENLPAGRYYILAGFVDSPTYYPGVTATTTATSVAVTARATVTGIDFQAARASTGLTLSGRLKRDTNEGVGGMSIFLSGNDQYPNLRSMPDGSFEFTRLRPGAYSLSVSTPNFPPQQIVLVDKDISGMEFIVPWSVDVSGNVSVEGGGIRPNLNVTFAGGSRGTSTTNGRETFRITLPEGAYAVAVNGIPSGFFVKSIKSGPIDLQTEPLKLARASAPPVITITLGVSSPSPWVKLTGRVTGLPGPRTSETRLSLSGPISESLAAVVGADGSFEFPKLLPGTYTISIAPTPIPMPQTSIIMPNSDLNDVLISLPALREISGKISVEDGGPLAATSLSLFGTFGSAADTAQPTRTQLLVGSTQPRNTIILNLNLQQDGTFKTLLPEGQYRITALPQLRNANGSVYATKAFSYGAVDLTRDALSVLATDTASMNLTLGPTSPMVWSKVSGRVTGVEASFLTANPLTVTLVGSGLLTNWSSPVKPDGSFEFPKIYPGTYTARVVLPAGTPNNPGGTLNFNAATATINASGTDIAGLEIAVPRQKEVTGRVSLEGRGPMPRFTVPLLQSASASTTPVTLLSISPQPDGTFRATLQEGERNLGIAINLPSGYAIKSLTYGATDILKNPLKVARADTAELRVVLTAPVRAPVSVSGRIIGLDGSVLGPGPVSVTMTSASYVASLASTVKPDGTFGFPDVFPGSYSAGVTGRGILNSANVQITVANTDVQNVELIVPRQKEIAGRVILDGQGFIPRFQIAMPLSVPTAGVTNTFQSMSINPQQDGTFKVSLLVGDHQAGTVSGLPPGYAVKSVIYGTTDILKNPLRLSESDKEELLVTLTTPNRAPVSVSGRINGLSDSILSRGGVTVSMTSPSYVPLLSAPVMTDGTFKFPEVFSGTYSPRLSGPGVVNSPTVPIVVGNSDVQFIEITVPRQKEITGKVVLEGSGPMARMNISLSPAAGGPTARIGVPQGATAGQPTGPASALNINPQPDGTFRLTVQNGEYRVGSVNGLPPGYALKSLTYGSTEILTSPLRIAESDSYELRAVVTTSSPTPVRVSGRVIGLDAASFARGPVNATMLSGMYGLTLNTVVNPDGTFEFPTVYPGGYAVRAFGAAVLSSPNLNVTVANADVRNVEILVPSLKDITGHLVIEGGGPYPFFALPLASLPASVATPGASGTLPTIRPGTDGTFHIGLPIGESRLTNFIGLPPGYTVKSFFYGSTDLLKDPLKVALTDTAEFQMVIVNKATPVKVSGRVDGLDPGALSANPIRVTLRNSSFVIPITADVRANGTFEFPGVYPGNYRVSAEAVSAQVLPVGAPLVVSDREITDLVVAAPK